jgi:hypothetical protein
MDNFLCCILVVQCKRHGAQVQEAYLGLFWIPKKAEPNVKSPGPTAYQKVILSSCPCLREYFIRPWWIPLTWDRFSFFFHEFKAHSTNAVFDSKQEVVEAKHKVWTPKNSIQSP